MTAGNRPAKFRVATNPPEFKKMKLSQAQKMAFIGMIEDSEIEDVEQMLDEQRAAREQVEFIRGLESPEYRRRLIEA